MKRFLMVVLMIGILAFAFAQDYNKINGNGQLPKDANRTGIQSGRYIRMFDNNPAAYEHVSDGDFTAVTKWHGTNDISIDSLSANWELTEYEHVNDGDFTIVTSWTATNDIAVDSLGANWTWVDSVVSNLTQPADSLLLAFVASDYVKLTYTIYDSVTVAGGDVTFTVGGFCATTNISSASGSHTYYITGNASAATDLLLFTVKADPNVTAGEFTIDDISIESYNDNVSYLSQPFDSLAVAFEANQYVVLNYTIHDSVTVTSGDVTSGGVGLTVGGFCATSTLSLTSGDHTYYITASSSAATDSLLFTITPSDSITAGEFSIDDITIGSYNQSPLSIANGAEVILTIPNNVVELILDPRGTDIKIEKYSNSVTINSARAIPCSGVNTITIANDSGGTATVEFYFNGI